MLIGIYIPTLANKILQSPNFIGPKLLGIAVGNGCTGTDAKSTCSYGFYCSGACPSSIPQVLMPGTCAGFVIEQQYLVTIPVAPGNIRQQVIKSCNWTLAFESTADLFRNSCNLSPKCISSVNSMLSYYTYIDYYNVYGECINPNFTQSFDTSCIQQGHHVLNNYHIVETMRLSNQQDGRDLLVANDDTGTYFNQFANLGQPAFCFSENSFLSEYLNNPATIRAIHARKPVGFCWGGCNSAPGFYYVRQEKNEPRDIYPSLVKQIKVVIYNGDFDAVVPYNDNYGKGYNDY